MLANPTRLRLIEWLVGRSDQCVSDIARVAGISESQASQYLRSLNARGLLHAERRGRRVFYDLRPDPTNPSSEILVAALRDTFADGSAPTRTLYRDATAFTHARRCIIVRALASGPMTFKELRVTTGIGAVALSRHMYKLVDRGIVSRCGRGRYDLSSDLSPMAVALCRLARAGA